MKYLINSEPVEVLDGKHHRISPLTQGGLEIKTKVTVERQRKVFTIEELCWDELRFRQNNEDQSPAILDKIKATI